MYPSPLSTKALEYYNVDVEVEYRLLDLYLSQGCLCI